MISASGPMPTTGSRSLMNVELLAQRVGLVDADLQVGVVELVVAYAQAVAWLPGVHRIGAVGEGVAHGFQRAGRRQQLGAVGGVHGAGLAGVSKARHFTALARRLRVERCPQ